MRKILSGKILPAAAILPTLAVLFMPCAAASAAGFSTPTADAQITLVQGFSETTRTNDRQHRPQRYICVVQPAQSDNRNRPYICRADAGRVGGTCRCANVVGNGRLDLDN